MSKFDDIQQRLENNRKQLVDVQEEWPADIKRAVQFIHNHQFDERLSVQWMKEQCCLNEANFSGRFKYYVGKLPKQYWLEHRIAVAKQLLKERSMADVGLLTIALDLGFRKHSSFTALFKEYVGCAPSNFRDKHQGD
jgi:AraC family transcriptional regulator